MGFDEVFIDMVWRIMDNNWYSIIINGKRHGFFHSTRGLKQGDPLSPALFILGAEVLSRSLNRLHNNPEYHGFFMESRGPQVNDLSFADDVILFTSGRQKTLKKLQASLLTLIKVTSWSILMLSTTPRKGSKESLPSGRRRVPSLTLVSLYLLEDLGLSIFLILLTKCCAESHVGQQNC